MHRVILSRILGRELLPKEQVDHIDGNGLNNRRSNLRVATAAQNQQNHGTPKSNTSGYKGVCWSKGRRKWEAKIKVAGKKIFLGLFDDPSVAHKAYCEAAKKYHGQFARTE